MYYSTIGTYLKVKLAEVILRALSGLCAAMRKPRGPREGAKLTGENFA